VSESVRARPVSCEPRDRPQERGEASVCGMLNRSTDRRGWADPRSSLGVREKALSNQGENAITCR
jgi:hypothetical protein